MTQKLYYASFDHFELSFTREQILFIPRTGKADYYIRQLENTKGVCEQLAKLDPEDVKSELRECGAWDEVDLSNHVLNVHRLLWIAIKTIQEENHRELYVG